METKYQMLVLLHNQLHWQLQDTQHLQYIKTPSKFPKNPHNSPSTRCSCRVCRELGPKPIQAPKQKCYIPIWAIADVTETPIFLIWANCQKTLTKYWFNSMSGYSGQLLNVIKEKEAKKKTKKIDFKWRRWQRKRL